MKKNLRCFYAFLFCIVFIFKVNADGSSVILQDFESIANPKGEFFVNDPNFASVDLCDNPSKSGINLSNKVAGVKVNTNSGIIKINFAEGVIPRIAYPSNPLGEGDLVPVYYDVLRFKYYKGKLMNKNIEFEPNGQPTNPKSIRPATGDDEWEYITFPLIYKSYQNFQIRVNRNENGTGAAIGTAPGEIIYVDDFEIYNSDAGPDDASAVKLTFEDKKFSCFKTKNMSFRVEGKLENSSDVKIELISLDGKCGTIYHNVSRGKFEFSFEVKEKGLYFLRITLNNKNFEVHKILA